MALPKNPFVFVAPRKDEFAPERKKIVDEIKKQIKGKHFFFIIYGERGVGRTLILKMLIKDLKNVEEYKFGPRILTSLKERAQKKKKSTIAIETVELTSKEFLEKIMNELLKLYKAGNSILITTTPETYEFIISNKDLKKVVKSYRLKGLTYDQAKAMVISRLNEVRKKKSNSLEPFTEKELKHIWLKARGNPRLILLICSFLYQNKMESVKA